MPPLPPLRAGERSRSRGRGGRPAAWPHSRPSTQGGLAAAQNKKPAGPPADTPAPRRTPPPDTPPADAPRRTPHPRRTPPGRPAPRSAGRGPTRPRRRRAHLLRPLGSAAARVCPQRRPRAGPGQDRAGAAARPQAPPAGGAARGGRRGRGAAQAGPPTQRRAPPAPRRPHREGPSAQKCRVAPASARRGAAGRPQPPRRPRNLVQQSCVLTVGHVSGRARCCPTRGKHFLANSFSCFCSRSCPSPSRNARF